MPAALPARGPLGQWIRHIREDELGMTATEFAVYIGASQAQVSNWELGRNRPSHRTAWFLAQHHGLPLELWFDFSPPEDSGGHSHLGCTGYARAACDVAIA